MKRKITLSIIAACSALAMSSQVVLSEDFTSPFSLAANGWTVVNNSVNSNTVSWTQGNQTGGNGQFAAFNGQYNDFYCADFLAVTGTLGGISAWLITPTLSIYNGCVLQFSTRTLSTTTIFPDRMQVRMDQTGSASIPTGSASVGTYTNLLLDINPNLTANTTSVVSNGSVNGYPQAWSVYTIQITGVTGTVTGRFAFRYYVDNGGSGGTNSRMVGVDAVRFTQPCGAAVASQTVCSGVTANLVATGGLPTTTYSWSAGGTTSSISVSPASTTVYTLVTSNSQGTCPNPITVTVTVGGSQLSMGVSASSSTICSGTTVTLTAFSSAGTYSWIGSSFTGTQTAQTITVNPSSNATYTVGGQSGLCYGANTIAITVNASPNVTVVNTPICLGSPSFAIGFFGANSYTFAGSTATAQAITTPTATGLWTINSPIIAANSNGCIRVYSSYSFSVNAPPTITASITKTLQCINRTATITTTGTADTYSWTGAGTGTNSSITFSTGTSTGLKSFSVVGTSTTSGCTASAVVNVSVSTCAGIDKVAGGLEASVFPNPFSNELKLSGLSGRVQVYNSIGQLVIDLPVVSENEIINTSELPKGAYILRVLNSNESSEKTIKLLKNN
jgi:hypothetical protein